MCDREAVGVIGIRQCVHNAWITGVGGSRSRGSVGVGGSWSKRQQSRGMRHGQWEEQWREAAGGSSVARKQWEQETAGAGESGSGRKQEQETAGA